MLGITSTSPLAPATVGVAYSNTFAASGGSGPYTWSTSNPLPSWLTLSSSGTLSGTPPSGGPVTFALVATDSLANHVSGNFTLPVNALLTIDTPSPPLPPGTVGLPYSLRLAASGGTGSYTWTSNNLPGWLALATSGLLSGTPPSATTASFTVNLYDGSANVSKPFSLGVGAALSIGNTSPLPAATLNMPYSVTFTASGGGGGYTWSASGLPSGFALSSTGLLTGTASSTSPLLFSVTLMDVQNNSLSQPFTLPVNAAVTISNSSLPAGTVGSIYTANFTASGGSGAYSWSGSSLPSWLTLTSAGFLTGTPPSAGPVSFQVTATDSQSQTSSAFFTVLVNSAVTIGNTSPLPPATAGSPYSLQLTASGGVGSYSWSSSNLPNWLMLTSSGLLAGTPPIGGPVTFSVNLADSQANSASANFTLPVDAAVTINTSSPLPGATPGSVYSLQLAASGGVGPYNWTAASLPSWLTLTSAGFLTGTPPSGGTVTFSATVTDSQGHAASGSFVLPVNVSLTIGNSSPLPTAVVGTSYSLQFTASGGGGYYSWAPSTLPQWLTLSSSGLLSGTPPSAGSASVFGDRCGWSEPFSNANVHAADRPGAGTRIGFSATRRDRWLVLFLSVCARRRFRRLFMELFHTAELGNALIRWNSDGNSDKQWDRSALRTSLRRRWPECY